MVAIASSSRRVELAFTCRSSVMLRRAGDKIDLPQVNDISTRHSHVDKESVKVNVVSFAFVVQLVRAATTFALTQTV